MLIVNKQFYILIINVKLIYGHFLIINGGSFNGTCNLTPKNYANTTVVKVPMIIGSPPNANKAVTAGAINGAACYPWLYTRETGGLGGYGICDVKTDAGGKVYFWLPESAAEKIILEANSTQYSATFARSGGMTDQTLTQNAETLPTPKRIPQASDFTFTLPPSVTYDGEAHPASVTCSDPGMGTFQILYNNSSPDAPVAAGSYSVYINVVEGTGYIARNFSIGSFTINRRSINSAGITVEITGSRVYTGAQLRPAFTVNDTGAPITTGDYMVYDWYWGANINAGTNTGSFYIFGQGNYTGSRMEYFDIEKAMPTVADLTVLPNPLEAVYDAQTHAVSVAKKGGINGMGTVSAPKYDGDPNPPSSAGEYEITVDITDDANYSAVTALPLGTFRINRATPTAAHLDFTPPASVTYNGTPQSVAAPTLKSPYSGTGAITVIYTGTNGTTYGPAATPPSNAGAYTLAANIAAGNNFNAAAGLPLTGNLIIGKTAPDIAALGITADLTKTPVRITVPAGITGLGDITVRYSGGTSVPGAPGTYEVTIDISEGANYTAATGLFIGYLTVLPPPSIRREVTLPQIPGATTAPPAGRYYVESGEDFVFTIYPDPSNSLLTLFVTAGRIFDANGGGVTWTANGDGSYTVRIRQIRENITVSVSFSTGNGVIDGGTRIWSHAGALYIDAARDGEARIYSLSGRLLKIIPLAAGESVRTQLAGGFYIVVSGRERYKVMVL